MLPDVDTRCEFCKREVGVGINCCALAWRKWQSIAGVRNEWKAIAYQAEVDAEAEGM